MVHRDGLRLDEQACPRLTAERRKRYAHALSIACILAVAGSVVAAG